MSLCPARAASPSLCLIWTAGNKGTALHLQKSRRNQPQRPRVNAPQVEALKGGGGSELEKMGKNEGRFVGGLALLFLVILLEGLFLAGSVRPS